MCGIELRNQVVIHKAKETSLVINTKNTISLVTVWGLWILSFCLIAEGRRFLPNSPVVLRWTLWKILRVVSTSVLIQLVILQAQSFCIRRVMGYHHKYHSGRGN